MMDDGAIIEKVFNNVGAPPGAEAYCRVAIMDAIRITREEAFSEIYREGDLDTGTRPEDRLWIEAARQVVNRICSFDEEKRKDFLSLIVDLNAEIGFRNMSQVKEIKGTLVEFLAPQSLGGLQSFGSEVL